MKKLIRGIIKYIQVINYKYIKTMKDKNFKERLKELIWFALLSLILLTFCLTGCTKEQPPAPTVYSSNGNTNPPSPLLGKYKLIQTNSSCPLNSILQISIINNQATLVYLDCSNIINLQTTLSGYDLYTQQIDPNYGGTTKITCSGKLVNDILTINYISGAGGQFNIKNIYQKQ